MSKVKIEGNASGTGTLTIAAPNTNTDRTLTLPDGAGEILLSDGDGSNLTGISSYSDSDALSLFNASGSAPVYACRAWVNFNGTGTVAIRASGNVSSITDLGVGQYRLNFTSSLADTNYAVIAMGTAWGTTAAASSTALRANQTPTQWEGTATTMTTSAVDIVHSNSTNTAGEDVSYMMAAVIR